MKSVVALLLALFLTQPFAVFAQDQKPPAVEQDDPKEDAPVTDEEIHKHADKKMDDVEAIGLRNVGCDRGLANWYSLDKQVMMGKQFAAMIERSSKLVTDPVITEYVNRIGQNIVRNSDAKVPFTIKVVDSDEVNAFALPGGYFYVNSGLIMAADNEAELAGVMAHEIGHVAACHAARGATRGNLAQLAMTPLIFLPMSYPVYIGAQEGLGLGVPAVFMKFSRSFEAQADYLGVQYMYKAGYDPNAYMEFFEKIRAMEKKKPGFMSKAFASHPPTTARIQKTQEEIAKILPPKAQYEISTSEFDDVKARLAALQNKRVINSDQEKKPTLRRSPDAGKDDPNGDDRPTLKRRPGDQ